MVIDLQLIEAGLQGGMLGFGFTWLARTMTTPTRASVPLGPQLWRDALDAETTSWIEALHVEFMAGDLDVWTLAEGVEFYLRAGERRRRAILQGQRERRRERASAPVATYDHDKHVQNEPRVWVPPETPARPRCPVCGAPGRRCDMHTSKLVAAAQDMGAILAREAAGLTREMQEFVEIVSRRR